jgi:hypothetical protein
MLQKPTMIDRVSLALPALLLCFGAAAAQQAAQPSAAPALQLDLPAPADTGKPRAFNPHLDPAPPPGCAVALNCRLRVIGEVQHNGAVELNATLFKW